VALPIAVLRKQKPPSSISQVSERLLRPRCRWWRRD
jgi:hypothetical protein